MWNPITSSKQQGKHQYLHQIQEQQVDPLRSNLLYSHINMRKESAELDCNVRGSTELVCERKTFSLGWVGSLVSLEERKGFKIRRGFLSLEGALNLGSYLLECTITEKRRSSLQFMDSFCSININIRSNENGLFIEAVVSPKSTKGKWVSFCFPAGSECCCWKSLGDLITHFTDKTGDHPVSFPCNLTKSITPNSYRDVLLNHKYLQPARDVHISASFQNNIEDWEKLFLLLNENRIHSKYLEDDVHRLVKTGKIIIEMNVTGAATEQASSIFGEEDGDGAEQDTGGVRCMVGKKPVLAEPDKTVADTTTHLGLWSEVLPCPVSNLKISPPSQTAGSLKQIKGLGHRRKVDKAAKSIGPPYPWISLMHEDFSLSDLLPTSSREDKLLQRDYRKDLRAHLVERLDSHQDVSSEQPTLLLPDNEIPANLNHQLSFDDPHRDGHIHDDSNQAHLTPAKSHNETSQSSLDPMVEGSKEGRTKDDKGMEGDYEDTADNRRIEALDFTPEDEMGFYCEDSDVEFQRVSDSFEFIETSEEGDEADSRQEATKLQELNYALVTMGARLGVQESKMGGNFGVSLPSVIDDFDRKLKRAIEKPRRTSAGKKPQRYIQQSQQSSQSGTF